MSLAVFAVVVKVHLQSWISSVAVDMSTRIREPVLTLGIHISDTENIEFNFETNNIYFI